MLDYLNLFFNNIFKSSIWPILNMLIYILTILFFAIHSSSDVRKIKTKSLMSYGVVGALIGPYGLNISGFIMMSLNHLRIWCGFLLFVIGLELTIDRLLAVRK